ncbi:MAG: ATP-binding protein [Rikenellaceae bacterium]|nr:ATP-binding protein [Rikenellaceae bacterium]
MKGKTSADTMDIINKKLLSLTPAHKIEKIEELSVWLNNLFTDLNKRNSLLLEASVKASQILISNHNFYDAVNEVIEIIGESIPNNRVFIYEFHKDIINNDDLISLRFEKEQGKDSKRVFGNKHQNIPVGFFPDIILNNLKRGNIVSSVTCPFSEWGEFLLIPIFVEGSEWGFLGVESNSIDDDNYWNECDRNAMSSIASSLGQYINRHFQSLELIMAKELAEESEIYANSLFDQSPLCIHIASTSGVIEKVNKSSESIFSVPQSNVISKFNILTNPISVELGWNKFFKEAIASENEVFKKIIFDPGAFGFKGERKVLSAVAFPIKFKGRVKKIAIMYQDITKNTRNELLLKIQRNLAYSILSSKNFSEFYTIVSNEVDSIIPDNNLYVAFYNEQNDTFSIGGINRDDIDIHIESWPAKKSMTGYVLSQGKTTFVKKEEILELFSKGIIELVGAMAEVWLGVPFRSDSGVSGAIVIQNYNNPDAINSSDIEIIELIANEIKIFLDKKSAEESTIKLTKAVTESPASVVITNAEGKIEYVNPKFITTTGYSFEDVNGSNPRILKSGDTPQVVYKNMWDTILSGKEWRGELKNRKKNGEYYWEDISISPIIGDDGAISHYIAIKEDISDRKILINQLIEARDRAQESDKLKTAFLQNISHEIRTPMNGILGFIELLRDPALSSQDQNSYIDIIEKSSHRMLKIINDLIDISKIEAGIVQLKLSEVCMPSMLHDVVTFFSPEAEKKGIKIELRCAESINNLIITSDYEKIYASLVNLIKNAIKYSIKGEIIIEADICGEFIELSVTDTGIGIPEEKLEKIFERFTQVESSSISRAEGAGLGLSIVKAYIDILGGSIWVESKLGIGSRFSFTIPLSYQGDTGDEYVEKSSIVKSTENMEGNRALKIIVAEDEETNALYIKTILKSSGYNLLFAHNGVETVNLFKQNPDTNIILMDLRMPEMDGFEAARLIRGQDKNVVIIAQTAFAFTEDKESVMGQGFNDYISKPIRKDELKNIIFKHSTK